MARTARAAVVEKQSRAIALHSQGASYNDIAEELGFKNRGSAWKCVNAGLRAERDARAGDYLQTQVARYESLLRTFWQPATNGDDAKAALVVLRTLERLDRLLRLGDDAAAVSQTTMVISADPQAYVAQLQHVVAERAQTR